jgi:hypothetical protein
LTEAEFMSKMNKVVITEFGDESKLAIVEDDLPDPAAGEVQLSVEYSIVSGSDVNMRRGTNPFQREASLTNFGRKASAFQAEDIRLLRFLNPSS